MTVLISLSFFLFLLVLLEVISYLLISWVRKRNSWFITYKDFYPELDQNVLTKFIDKGYDQELGWVRKPNTKGVERGAKEYIEWHINDKNARSNPGYENFASKISVYGDSFTFGRQVADNETWAYYLSQFTKTNVLNFGVGNYGIDQALLRLQRQYPVTPTPIVIMGIVPDTLSRILSVWKHYYEYGNIYGFKPRFVLDENFNLKLLPNFINSETKFMQYKNYLDEIQNNDFFYHNKFNKEIQKFPFFWNLIKLPKRNFLMINETIKLQKILEPTKTVMRINLNWRLKLYKNDLNCNLFTKIIEEFINTAHKENFFPILCFLPQKDDILFIKKHYHFYKKIIDIAKNKLTIIDLCEELSEFSNSDLDNLYSDQTEYGGHYSSKGNELVAKVIFEKLKILNQF